MKNLVIFLTTLTFLMFSSFTMAFEGDFKAEEITSFNTPLMEDAVIKQYAKMAQKFFISVEDYDVTIGNPETKSPASPLYYLEVYAAISSYYPSYEYFSQSQYSSIQNHGGSEMYIVTVELGYGNSEIAKMVGVNLTEIQSQAIVDSGIVVGYFRWWNASGYQNGQFTYRNTSINYPYNTMSDWINIQ